MISPGIAPPSRVALLLLSLLLAASRPSMAQDAASGAPTIDRPTLDDVLWWIPEDTELLSVIRDPFTIPSGDEWRSFDATPRGALSASVLQRQLMLALHGIHAKDQLTTPQYAGREVRLCVEAERNFRFTGGDGLMSSDGVLILVLSEPLALDGNRLEEQGARRESIDGVDYFVLREGGDEDRMTCAAMPDPSIVLQATSKGVLVETIQRRASRPQVQALPPELPQWSLIDREESAWALFHVRRATGDSGVAQETARAKGLVISMRGSPEDWLAVAIVAPASEDAYFASLECGPSLSFVGTSDLPGSELRVTRYRIPPPTGPMEQHHAAMAMLGLQGRMYPGTLLVSRQKTQDAMETE